MQYNTHYITFVETSRYSTIELRATATEIVAPKPDLGSKARKDDFEALFKRVFKRKSADKSVSQPGCSHSNMIYDAQLQKTIMLCTQPRRQATLTQPLQCDLHRQWRTRMYLRTWQQNIATFMQPLHCALPLQIAKDPITAHKRTAARCKTPCRNM